MERIAPLAKTDAIQWVMDRMPSSISRRLGTVPFIIGVDPIYIGLHNYETTDDFRSNRNTSHVCPRYANNPALGSWRESTVVLTIPDAEFRLIVLHELGHVLHDRLELANVPIVPLDSYAAMNRYEAFATSFQSWMNDFISAEDCGEYYHTRTDVMGRDPAAFAFFEALSR